MIESTWWIDFVEAKTDTAVSARGRYLELAPDLFRLHDSIDVPQTIYGRRVAALRACTRTLPNDLNVSARRPAIRNWSGSTHS